MSDYDLSVETLEYVGGGSNKFYRGILIKDGSSYWSVTQWGSQRGGRTGGQAAVKVGGNMYYDKLQEKRGEGYSAVQSECGTWTLQTGSVEHTNLTNAFRNKDGKAAAAVIERVMGGVRAPAGSQPTSVTCNDCGAIYNTRQELQQHMARTHASQSSSGTATVQVVEKDSLGVLAERALSALSTAATDPTAALVERASIVTALKEEQKKIDRVQSYLDSLDLMIDDELV